MPSEARAWVAFYYALAEEIHPERWRGAGLGQEAATRLLAGERSRRTLSVNPECLAPAWNFSWNPWDRVEGVLPDWAFRSGEILWKTGVYFAMGCFRSEIAKLVHRQDVFALRRDFGDDAYFFAMRQAVLLWAGDWPDAAADAASLPLVEKLRLAAVRGLACWLGSLPVGVASRVRLKLNPELDKLLAEAVGVWDGEARETCLKRLAKLNNIAM